MKIKLVCNQQIGDCVKTTTVAKLFKEQYPHFDIDVSMSHPAVFFNNPYVKNNGFPKPEVQIGQKVEDEIVVNCRQDDKDEAGNEIKNPHSIHGLKFNNATFLKGMVGYINARYGFELKPTQEEPDIHLSEDEKQPISWLPEKYWVVNCGGEKRNTRKLYPRKYWTEIFKALPDITFLQLGVSKDWHEPYDFPNVINGIDKLDIRGVMQAIYHAQGVIVPITFMMHVAAAFHKPCIALAGGGEDVSWENYEYDGFNYVHTIGSFPCCQGGGCWKSECDNQEPDGTQKCMELIKPELIIALIKKYAD